MQIDAAHLALGDRGIRVGGSGAGVDAGGAEHGEDDGEGGVAIVGGRVEADVQDRRFVDEGVDGGVVVGAWMRSLVGDEMRGRVG